MVLTLMISIMNSMVAQYIHEIELKSQDSEPERKHVEVMFNLFSIHWMVASFLNLVMVRDPQFVNEWSETFRDFGIGAILGVNIVILIEYGRGFSVPSQDESTFLRVIAFCLNVMGVIWYLGLLSIIILIIQSVVEHREQGQKRLKLVARM